MAENQADINRFRYHTVKSLYQLHMSFKNLYKMERIPGLCGRASSASAPQIKTHLDV